MMADMTKARCLPPISISIGMIRFQQTFLLPALPLNSRIVLPARSELHDELETNLNIYKH